MYYENDTFARNPQVSVSRSRFDRSCSHKTSFNVGDVVPFYVDEVLPGDTMSIDTSKVVRLQTLIAPVMDNLYLDTYYYFVPNRLVWDHWQELMGENRLSAWTSPVEYEVPQVVSPTGGWNVGTIADYMGIPIGVENLSINALPFRAYALIMQEWFRDQNLTDPPLISKGDEVTTGSNGSDYIVDLVKGGMPFVAAKTHDYFTSCLPAPQKGPDVTIPVSQGSAIPVYATSELHNLSDMPRYPSTGGVVPMVHLRGSGDGTDPTVHRVLHSQTSTVAWQGYDSSLHPNSVSPMNLWAIDDGSVSSATINQLRMAFQLQKLYEKDARGGTRYVEMLKAHFGVTSPDSRLQRPEYLGGSRLPITISQVVQSSETGSTPQGNTSGFSLTTDVNSDFTKSFVEHGFVIGVMVSRYNHTYQQGIERFWSRRSRYDYYWPVFANIGEQAVKNREIYADGSTVDDEVFGYQEAWADYRYKPSRSSAYLRSTAPTSLDLWHFGDHYESRPFLSDEWIRESLEPVDRALAVQSDISHQLISDIYIRNRTVRAMPLRSIPGLIDHH